MCCSRLLMLRDLLDQEQIEKLEKYFSGLIGGAAKSITVSKVATALNISSGLASKILTKCKEKGVLSVCYCIRCPMCNTLIKKVNSLAEIPEGTFICYSCDEEIEIEPGDIEIIYSLNDESVFIKGQRKEIINEISARSVVPENTMEEIFLAGNVNEYLFHPKEEEYDKLLRMYNNIESREGTTKKIGDTLEGLTKYLFNLCPVFQAAEIKTTTNQIDCCIRNKMYLKFGIMDTIGQRFFIECKNENKTPRGDYMSKLHSIISLTNAGGKGQCIKFGIIISKEKGPSTFKELAVKSYLADGVVIISICGEELKELFDNRGNLLDLIERKTTEIMLDSTTDLVKAGLYKS